MVCLNENNNKISQKIKEKNCYTINCFDDWETNKKKLINESNLCFDISNNNIFYNYEYQGLFYENCLNGYLTNNETIKYCKCENERCHYCSDIPLSDNLYEIENDDFSNGYKKCYKNPIGYYLDVNEHIYKKCYASCKKCEIKGNNIAHKCIECDDNYPIVFIVYNYSNCYQNCSYYYYFDKYFNYHCTINNTCPDEYPLLDEMQESYRKMEVKNAQKTILIAPSWQKDNIVDSCLEELLDNLGGHEYKIIVRPHPQHVRHMKGKMDALKEKYKNNPEIEIQTDFSSNSTVFEADALITDWSDIGTEYAFTTYKPVLYINTPMKIMNPEYEKIPVEPLNIRMRNIVGKSLELNELDKAYETVKELVENGERYHNQIKDLVEEEMYHLGDSAVVGARYIIMSVFEHINQKENS